MNDGPIDLRRRPAGAGERVRRVQKRVNLEVPALARIVRELAAVGDGGSIARATELAREAHALLIRVRNLVTGPHDQEGNRDVNKTVP